MAVTRTHANNVVTKWRKQFYREWRRGNLFSPYMGESPTAVIQVLRDLADGGDQVNIPFVSGLRGPGVSTGPLVGNEEKLDTFGMRAWVDWCRNAVLLTKAELRKSAIEQLETVRPLLTEWAQVLMRDELVLALMSLPSTSPPAGLGDESVGGARVNGILYSAATAAQKNTWNTENQDRIVYGNTPALNYNAVHATALQNVDSTNDRLTAASLLIMKRKARKATGGITPYRASERNGREYFIVFAGSNAFRDLAADPVIVAANQNARPREDGGMDENPLFQDGDLIYRGVIVREIPEIDTLLNPSLLTAGAGGTTAVTPVFMCGQNSLAVVYGQMPKPTERKEDDYGFLIGRGVEAVYGIAKTARTNPTTGLGMQQFGVVTGFFASVEDA
jgi:hypothetical protein